MKRKFKDKTIGSRKGITWIVLLLSIIAQNIAFLSNFLEANMWTIAFYAITVATLLLDLSIVTFEKIKIDIKYGK